MTQSATPPELLEAKREPDLVKLPERTVLVLSGAAPPASPEFAEAVGALLGVAWTLRGLRKKAGGPVFKVGTLEAEWWAEGDELPEHGVPDPGTWRWRLRTAVPDDVTPDEVETAIRTATTKKGGKLEGSRTASRVELTTLPAEQVARILHVGPYSEEPASFERIDELLSSQGLARYLGHVEVYLSDPARTAPDKLRTVLVVGVAPSG